ncbi:hypothetical protein [Luteibaculum oceani]|uniref:DUF1579 domain-containing protein n=1 Tax=Luteibaculum oceani TaxID=1294296 RepID=A0A5C6USC6_9FLAO|nr:hypothetical protein [Luteibaculum oceani]TXC75570.1 hypothetical protein FRX97_11905 [Luteibaculum oceani]
MRKITLVLLSFLFISPLFAQKEAPCTGPNHTLLDFWVGDWALSWGDNKVGTNKIEKILGGCVIEENFKGDPGIPNYYGKSVSSYDATDGKWKQVWVDNAGGWLDFVGAKVGDEVHFSRETRKNGVKILQRMRFYNINFRSFDWSWESSDNNGQTWKVEWAIHYERLNGKK